LIVACRTYLDSGVLIAAWRGLEYQSNKAISVLDDSRRTFIVSDFIVLETIAKPTFNKFNDEVTFMRTIFNKAERIMSSEKLTKKAVSIACKYDLTAIDALHISAAIMANVDEFITSEKQTKPMFKITELNVISLDSIQA